MRVSFFRRRSLVVAFALCLATVATPGSLTATAATASDPSAVQSAIALEDQVGPGTRARRELLRLRTRSSRTYEQTDGTRLKVVSAGPINFRNAIGEWQPIDNRLRASSLDGYAHENSANSYDLQLPTNVGVRPVRVQIGGAWVSYALDGARGSGSIAGTVKTYPRVLPETDLRLSALADGVKEDLILSDATAPHSFSYSLKTSRDINPRLNADGGIDFVDSNDRTIFVFASPFASDSSGTAAGHRDLRYGLRRMGSHYTVTLTLDRAWLRSPAREWPVVVDPSLIVRYASRDCYITSGSSANTSFCRDAMLKVGWNGTRASRALLYFPVQENDEEILGATIRDVEMSLHLNSKTSSNAANLTAHRLTNEWFTDATWNRRDGYTPIAWTTPGGDFETTPAATANTLGGSLGWKTWDSVGLARAVQDWVDGRPNLGLLIKQDTENVNNVLSFGSKFDLAGNYPQMTVTYEHEALVQFSLPMTPEDTVTWAQARGLTLKQMIAEHDDGQGSTFENGYVVDGTEADLAATYHEETEAMWGDLSNEAERDTNTSAAEMQFIESIEAEAAADASYLMRASVAGDRQTIEALSTDPSVSGVDYRYEVAGTPDEVQAETGSAWWPYIGKIVTRNSSDPRYAGTHRYLYQSFKWSPDRLANLQSYESEGYEHEAWYDNYDGEQFLGKRTTWASSMKKDYLDTEALNPQDDKELGYTVGTYDAGLLVANKYYEIFFRTRLGNATTDRGKVLGSRVHRRGSFCGWSPWCMKQDAARPLVPAWDHDVPGAKSWSNGP